MAIGNVVAAVLFLCVVSVAVGKVWRTVYERDGQTPFNDRNVMVGTNLTIIVTSDANGYWVGDLTIEGEDQERGLLSARDFNEVTADWEGSRFEAAGGMARVWDWEESGIDGFTLSGHSSAVPGDWFIIDYTATGVGSCKVWFYDNFVRIDSNDFLHVPVGDFNGDTIVDSNDFARLAIYWQADDCGDPYWCEGTDLDISGKVDFKDWALFADHWLEAVSYDIFFRDPKYLEGL